MVKSKKPQIPQNKDLPLSIWELDRLNNISKDFDDLENTLFFSLEPDCRRFRPELIAVLKETKPNALNVNGWV